MDWYGQAYALDAEKYSVAMKQRNVELIESGITQILLTVPGERRMLPEFGSRVKTLLFEPHDETLYAEIGTEVVVAVERWEPRVILVDVHIQGVEDNEHAIRARVVWAMKTNRRISSTLDLKIETGT